MNQALNNRTKLIVRISVCMLLLISICTSCGMQKLWRSYEPQPFNSQKWRSGDAIERGTMVMDLYTKRLLTGKTSNEVMVLLGTPDSRTRRDGLEVWLYKVEMGGADSRPHFPVSFDKDDKAFAGVSRNGTISVVTY